MPSTSSSVALDVKTSENCGTTETAHVAVAPRRAARRCPRSGRREGSARISQSMRVLADDRRDRPRGCRDAPRSPLVGSPQCPTTTQPVLGVAGELARDQARAAAGADDQRSRRGPASCAGAPRCARRRGTVGTSTSAAARKMNASSGEKTRSAEEAYERLADEQQRERARQQRVEEQPDLVEARDRDAPVVALVQAVGGEGREQHDAAPARSREERVRRRSWPAGRCGPRARR